MLSLTGAEITDFLANTDQGAKPLVFGVDNLDPQKTYLVATEDYLVSKWPGANGLSITNTGKRVSEFVIESFKSPVKVGGLQN